MPGDSEVRLVELAGLHLLYDRRDHAFIHVMDDFRAKLITADEIRIGWQIGDADPEIAWTLHGMAPFPLASIHYWRHGIDFDYVDVGANFGLTTIAQAVFYKRCGKHNKIYAFEPGQIFGLLERAVKLNQVDDLATCVRAAVTDYDGEAQFYLTPTQSSAGSLLAEMTGRPGIEESAVISVDAVTFDRFAERMRPAPGLLAKIDAEGADFKVIAGMRQTLSERLCTLQIELYPALIDGYADPVAALGDLTAGYDLVDVGAPPYRRIGTDQATIAAFVNEVRGRPNPTTDIFLVPKTLPAADDLVARIVAG